MDFELAHKVLEKNFVPHKESQGDKVMREKKDIGGAIGGFFKGMSKRFGRSKDYKKPLKPGAAPKGE
jgi:hypothetical protein